MTYVSELLTHAEELLAVKFREFDDCAVANQARVLDAFRRHRVSDFHLHGSNGYGYGDSGREVIEHIYSDLFAGESSLVRAQFASGTHALACALFGVLRPGDELVVATGEPYDTLGPVIGHKDAGQSSLRAWGINCRVVPLLADGAVDMPALASALTRQTRLVHIQRSRGYHWRKALSLAELARIVEVVKAYDKDIVCLVDNCYGEFVNTTEPGHLGADLTVGSLIKNPGGGLALTGGYIVGRDRLVRLAAERLYAPGIAGQVGASFGMNRGFLQGLFLAPAVVSACLKGASLLAQACELLGLDTSPGPLEPRGDIIQAVRMPSCESLIEFCQRIQSASPIDAHVKPLPGKLPGYDCDVVMAAGTFVLGASSELSADAPLREPLTAYVQGGLSYAHIKVALAHALPTLLPRNSS
ncbi:MAG: methionine gamma-lyase family protein [Selenomonadales bacterium]|nr:methionine gamma-lyase family protein [Selenomonadales bacterium]